MFDNLANVYAQDKGAYEDGAWVAFGHESKIKVRSPRSAHARAVRKKLEAPYSNLLRLGRELPDDVVEKMLVDQLSQSLIVDWDGKLFQDKSGEKIPATPENIKMALAHESFRDDVGSIIANRDTFKAQGLEDDAKN